MSSSPHESDERSVRVGRLLAKADVPGAFALVALPGGANSKAFRVDLANGARPLFFKEYCIHPEDSRDRLGTEFLFASYAWDHGLRNLARPYIMDRASHGAIYAFLDGRKLEPREISPGQIQ